LIRPNSAHSAILCIIDLSPPDDLEGDGLFERAKAGYTISSPIS
jgi:hypothetical protein